MLLAVVACGSYFVSSTYAKYTREYAGNGTATVAKFSVSAKASVLGADGSTVETALVKSPNTVAIDLFKTVKEEDATTKEDHVNAGLIAPGTGGEFKVSLENASEVDVKAVVLLTETNNSNVPIEYSIDGGAYAKAGANGAKLEINDVPASKDIVVKWRWIYETNVEDQKATLNEEDTVIGEKTEDVNVITNVSVVFTQVD